MNPLSTANIRILKSGFVTARLRIGGRPVIILGWRHVHMKAPKTDRPDGPKDWIGPALHLEYQDGSRHHGFDPATIGEVTQAFHGLEQAREALSKMSL